MRCLLGVLILFSVLSATHVVGEIFPANNLNENSEVNLSISGEKSMNILLKNRTYSINLPPGKYLFTAKCNDSHYNYFLQKNITLQGERVREDLILIPLTKIGVNEFSENLETSEFQRGAWLNERTFQIIAGIIILICFMFGFVAYYTIFNKSADEAIAGMKQLNRPIIISDKKNNEGWLDSKGLSKKNKSSDIKLSCKANKFSKIKEIRLRSSLEFQKKQKDSLRKNKKNKNKFT